MRSDDLAPLLAPPEPEPSAVSYRQGTVVAWDTSTGANTVEVRGTQLANLPILDSSDVALIKPGDVVGILAVGAGGPTQYFVLGRTVIPGTSGAGAAAAFVNDLLDARIAVARVAARQTTTDGNNWVNLATAGPQVTANVRAAGRVQVHLSATIQGSDNLGVMGVEVSGATSRAPSFGDALVAGTVGAPVINSYSVGRTIIIEGLNPGPTTFTAKYRSGSNGVAIDFADRHLAVMVL